MSHTWCYVRRARVHITHNVARDFRARAYHTRYRMCAMRTSVCHAGTAKCVPAVHDCQVDHQGLWHS